MQYIFSWFTILIYTFFVFYFSLTPKAASLMPKLPYIDKLIHFLIYLVFNFITLNTLILKKKNHPYIFSFGYTFLVGLITEFLQCFFPYRSFEVFDILANTVGIIFGLRFRIYD